MYNGHMQMYPDFVYVIYANLSFHNITKLEFCKNFIMQISKCLTVFLWNHGYILK